MTSRPSSGVMDWRLLGAAWVVAAMCAGCAPSVSLTLDVYTDLVPFEEFDVVRLRVDGVERDVPTTARSIFVPTPQRFEAFSVSPGATVDIEVLLLRRTRPVLTRHLTLPIRSNAVVPVWLLRSCLRVSCPNSADRSATECDDGRCVPPMCEESTCPMTGSCVADTDCRPLGASCARASCEEGRCAALPIAGACSMDEWCNAEVGCVPRTASEDAGMPDAGRLDAGESDTGVDAGPPDAPVDVPLPDCVTDAECPPPLVGGWSGCGFSSTCAETTPDETRTTTNFVCSTGTCQPSPVTENRPCTRSTGGIECARQEMGAWGPCVYGVTCPIVGIREATLTTYACGGGACGSSSTVVRDSSGCPPFTEVCDLFDNDCDGRCDPGCRVPVARSYRDATQSHLFTLSASEAACCGFAIEQFESFFIYSTNVGAGLIPLNRCYVPTTNHHVYGTSGCEGVPDAIFEFVIGYISPTPVFCGATPLYRLTLEDRSFITVLPSEVTFAVSIGWTDRGVIGYVWTD